MHPAPLLEVDGTPRPAPAWGQLWAQAHQVWAGLSGPPWRQHLTGGSVPDWLAGLVAGHVNAYAGPDPVLFRTAGLAGQWVAVARTHPAQLQLVCGPGTRAGTTTGDLELLEGTITRLAGSGATVDADVYVTGDGRPDGMFTARFRHLFAIYPTGQAAAACPAGDRFRHRQYRTRHGHTVELTPRIGVPGC